MTPGWMMVPLGLQLQAETQACQLVSSCIWTSCQLVTSCIWMSCQLVTYCIWLLTATGYLGILSTASGCPVNWLLTASGYLDIWSTSYLPHLDVLSIGRGHLGMSKLLSHVNIILKLFCKPFRLQNQSIHRCRNKTCIKHNIFEELVL